MWLAWAYEQCRDYGIKEIILVKRTECKWYFINASHPDMKVSWCINDSSKDRRIFRRQEEAAMFVMQVLQRRYKAAKEVWKRRHTDMMNWYEKHIKE